MKDVDFPESLEEDTSWREEYEAIYARKDSEAAGLNDQPDQGGRKPNNGEEETLETDDDLEDKAIVSEEFGDDE